MPNSIDNRKAISYSFAKNIEVAIMVQPVLINLAMVFDRPTGIATYGINVAKHLADLNPILLSATNLADLPDYSVPGNMTPAEGSRGHFRRLWWTQWQLPRIYQELNSNLIYSPIPEAPLYSKCRYVVMCHDLIPLRFPQWRSPLTNYFRYIVPVILDRAQHIICNSVATAQDIINYYGIAASKITPILLAYDSELFSPRSTPAKLNFNQDKPYFLYLGRHDPYKNLTRLLAAFSQLKNPQDYHLYLAGSFDPRFTPLLQQQVRELNLTAAVKFLDYVPHPELPNLLSNALALVFPTLWEGFGLPVLEAMACGTPVITSNLASLPEVTAEAAILIDPQSTPEITTAMNQIATDSQMRSQLQELGLARAKLFSWAKTGAQTAAVLKQFS